MIDEEKAINYTNNTHIQYNEILLHPEVVDEIRKAYLAGLEAGKDMAEADLATIAYMQGAERYKPKWHKVADGDLPNDYRYVWTNVGAGYYDDGWWDAFGRLQGVIAWCEPKFEE